MLIKNLSYHSFLFYLIRWKPNIIYCIHGHYGSCRNYLVLSGKLKETIYKQTHNKDYYLFKTRIVDKNQSAHINDVIGQHSVRNISGKNSLVITLLWLKLK